MGRKTLPEKQKSIFGIFVQKTIKKRDFLPKIGLLFCTKIKGISSCETGIFL